MKIGVITHCYCPMNYGQLLQGCALQKVLRTLGHEPVLIRYSHRVGKKTRFKHALKVPQRWIPALIRRLKENNGLDREEKKRVQVLRNFDGFRAKHLIMTDRIFQSYDELNQDVQEFDAYVVGSDQVWACQYLDIDTRPWFLGFGCHEVRRIAYAASFGASDIPRDNLDYMRPLFAAFKGISVREASGVGICAQAGYPDAVHVLDPTLLLQKKDYLEWIAQDNVDDEENENSYAFLYFLTTNMDVPWKEIQTLCARTECDTRFVAVGKTSGFPFDEYENPTPARWLSMIAHAKFIFTNSFHGTCFSIIMKRPFVVFLRQGVTAKINERLYSLLKKLGLEDRIYRKEAGGVALQMSGYIDWNDVDRRLLEMRDSSIMFLKNMLN